jgi:hypothetical protein
MERSWRTHVLDVKYVRQLSVKGPQSRYLHHHNTHRTTEPNRGREKEALLLSEQ